MREHRTADACLQATTFRLRETTEEAHQHLVALTVGIDPPAELRHPQVDAVVRQLREHQLELTARERTLRLSDHERAPPAARVGDILEES